MLHHVNNCLCQVAMNKKVTKLEVDIFGKKKGLVIRHDSSKQWQSPIGRTRLQTPQQQGYDLY